jgi:nucleotide-binding universal stress UspA family protein
MTGAIDRPRVVVGVDGSAGSRAALAHAFLAAARRGADLDVVSSLGMELLYLAGEPVVLPDIASMREDCAARARAMAAEVQDELATTSAPGVRDITVTVTASEAPAAHALLDRAEGAALLVVGSRGRGAMRSALLGSVALHCVTHAPCPVQVVHSPLVGDGSPTRVLVGVDGSDSSRAALVAAMEEAVSLGADVEAVASFAPADYWTDLSSIVIPSIEDIRAGLRARTDLVVQDVLAERRDRGDPVPPVRIEVVEGPAPEVLEHRARPGDLLVVGSRGRGAFRGLLLGSVALHCAMHAPCAVLVVHPQPGRRASGDRRPGQVTAGR